MTRKKYKAMKIRKKKHKNVQLPDFRSWSFLVSQGRILNMQNSK